MSDEKTTSRATSSQQARGASSTSLENACAMPWPLEVLIATADAEVRRSLTDLLAESGLSPVLCSSLSEAQSILVREPICLVFCDYHLPDGDFRDVLYEVRRHAPSVPVVVSNRLGGCHQFLNVLQSGAFDYIDCIWPRQELQQIVRQALRTVSLRSLDPLADLLEEIRRNS
jgi:DNA-binding NtrC family response regulator